ncbi:MAG: hypothetical protein P8X70_02870 [Nanoarchaeota archaeon]
MKNSKPNWMSISKNTKLFKLKNKSKLKSDYLPTYLVGNFKDNFEKYILFGINPGFSEKQNPKEESWKKSSWKDYLNFIKNFFILFKEHKMKSRYYKRLSQLFSGFDNEELKNYNEIYNYYHKHLINIELIPYHSTNFSGTVKHFSEKQIIYIKKRLKSNLDFLGKLKIKLLIFNGNIFYSLMIKNNLIKDYKKINLNKHVNMYIFNLENIPCILFDKFITQAYFGLSYEDFKYKIPSLLKSELKSI